MIENNPVARGGMVDERVIYNAAEGLRSNILILSSGQQIYKTKPNRVNGKVDICLLLNRGHYQLCLIPEDIQNMKELLNCDTHQEIVLKMFQIRTEKEQKKVCKKPKNKNKFNWTK